MINMIEKYHIIHLRNNQVVHNIKSSLRINIDCFFSVIITLKIISQYNRLISPRNIHEINYSV